MAQNGYLVHGTARELRRAADLLGEYQAVRAVVPYTPADKLIGRVRPGGRQRLAVQTLSGRDGAAARRDVADGGRELRQRSAVGGFRTQYVLADAAEAAELARDPGVVSISPAPAPELLDEAQNQILAGNTTGTRPTPALGARLPGLRRRAGGHRRLPVRRGRDGRGDRRRRRRHHPSRPPGRRRRRHPARLRRQLHDRRRTRGTAAATGRSTRASSAASTPGTGATLEDAGGFNYGLGIAPRARLGGSKIFRCSGAFGLTGSFTALTTNAYNKGARISSNSWGCGSCASTYSAESQEYDRLVRDALPGTAGNQEMVEVFSAGNDGPGEGTVGTPGQRQERDHRGGLRERPRRRHGRLRGHELRRRRRPRHHRLLEPRPHARRSHQAGHHGSRHPRRRHQAAARRLHRERRLHGQLPRRQHALQPLLGHLALHSRAVRSRRALPALVLERARGRHAPVARR